jgi:hypothetical protein
MPVPPHTIIFEPVHTATWEARAAGAPAVAVVVQSPWAATGAGRARANAPTTSRKASLRAVWSRIANLLFSATLPEMAGPFEITLRRPGTPGGLLLVDRLFARI